jgi:hypothetical protein
MRRHPSEEDLLDLLFDAGEPRSRSASHAAECAACGARLEELRAFLEEVRGAEAQEPERGPSYGAELFQRIAPRLGRPEAPETPSREAASPFAVLAGLFSPRRLAFAGGVLALVAVAFLAGRRWPSPSGIPESARERILLLAVGDHFDRSQLVLLELLNSDETPATAGEKRAEELVSQSRLYRQAALRSGDRALSGILDDLERLLLDVAHAPSSLTSEERDALRRRVAKSGVLFKVRILGARLDAETPSSPRI